MASIAARFKNGLSLFAHSLTVFIQHPQLLWYVLFSCLLTIIYLHSPLHNAWATVPRLLSISPLISIIVLDFLKSLPKLFIVAACCYHVAAYVDRNIIGVSNAVAQVAKKSVNLFLVAVLIFVPTLILFLTRSTDDVVNWLLVEPSTPGVALFSFIWKLSLFYVLVIVALEAVTVFRAWGVSCRVVLKTWLEVCIGLIILAILAGIISYVFMYMKRELFVGNLIDPITHKPNFLFKSLSAIEMSLDAIISLIFFVYRTLLYKQYKVGL